MEMCEVSCLANFEMPQFAVLNREENRKTENSNSFIEQLLKMPPNKSGSTSPEAKECEKSLGQPPAVPPQANVMNVSESIVKRINTGVIDEERRNAYDNYWLEKLACMDRAHTMNSKLDLDEISKIERRLRQYITGGKKCPLDRTRVTQCFIHNKNQTLKCARDVEMFLNCVDAHLYRAVRSPIDESINTSENVSYAERFKRGY